MDADFSHDPRYLPEFLKTIESADLVIGSRYIQGGDTPNWSFLRRFISGGGNIYTRIVLGLPIHDCTAGYRCYRREVLERLDLDAIRAQGYAFQVELVYRVLQQGFKIVEIPIIFMDRRVGKSKMSRTIFFEGFLSVLRMRFGKQNAAPRKRVYDTQIPQTDPSALDSVESEMSEVPSVVQK
jgi:dolichol-phosphate mannosyltransferase